MFMQYRKDVLPYRSQPVKKDERIEIVHPAADCSTVVPGQDFYVIGRFHGFDLPENARFAVCLINANGKTVRRVEGSVRDNEQGIKTDAEGILSNMSEAEIRASGMPDLVYDPENPESFSDTWIKAYYTNEYFAALIYGGTFDREHINPLDQYGNPLEPTEPGEYILSVELRLGDETICSSQTLRVAEGTKEIILSRYTCEEHSAIVERFAMENNFSVCSFPYPGIWDTAVFSCGWKRDCYIEIPPRWEYADSMEYLSDTVHCFTYNISEECVGYRTEIGAMLHQDEKRADDMKTTRFYYYRNGIPAPMANGKAADQFAVFGKSEYLAVTDVFPLFSNPCQLQIRTALKPIPAQSVQTAPNRFRIENNISSLRYQVRLVDDFQACTEPSPSHENGYDLVCIECPVGEKCRTASGTREFLLLQSCHTLELPKNWAGKEVKVTVFALDRNGKVWDTKDVSVTLKPGKPDLVLCDVDGTMIDNTQRITPAFERLKELIHEKQIPFTIATGRSPETIREYQEFLGLTLPALVNNGACAWSEEGLLWEETFPAEPIRDAILAADRMDMAIFMCMNGRELVYRYNAYIQREMDEYNRYNHFYIPLESEWKTLQFERVMLTDPQKPGRIDQIMPYLEPLHEDFTILRYDARHVDIMKKGISKGWGIRRLAKKLGLDTQKIMFIGDGANDIEMVREVGMGAAVANASPILKEIADYICGKSFTEGVIEALERFC